MKLQKIAFAIVGCTLLLNSATAQKVTIATSGESEMEIEKGSEHYSFTSGKNAYFITSKFKSAEVHYYMEAFSSTGTSLLSKKLTINGGVFNEAYSISDVLPLGGKVFAMIEHPSKSKATNTLFGRVIDDNGTVSEIGEELMSFAIEKPMNGGFYFTAVSNDQKKLAVVGLLPFVKEQPAKMKVKVFDETLKSTYEAEFTLAGEDTKNKHFDVQVANDGTVYLIKRTVQKNGARVLTVYQCSSNGIDSEYSIDVPADSRIHSYVFATSNQSELLIAGTYYKFTNVVVGDQKMEGIFYFTNKSKKETLFSMIKLNSPVENLTARKLLINGNTVFFTAVNFKEEKLTSTAPGATAFDYDYKYTYKDEYIIGIDESGQKKFELALAKNFTATNVYLPYEAGYFLLNDKLSILYNDSRDKYSNSSSYSNLLPVMVQITNDGFMYSPVVFMDELKLPSHNTMHPSLSTSLSSNTLAVLLRMGNTSKFMLIAVED